MRFLIIDDSFTMRRIIANILARLGHSDVIHAANGREALDRIENDGVEFVISDWYMPEMNGLDFVRTIRGNPATQDLPILIVTANAASGDVVQAMKLKVNGYVLKPFRIEVLKDKIASMCTMSASIASASPRVGESPRESPAMGEEAAAQMREEAVDVAVAAAVAPAGESGIAPI